MDSSWYSELLFVYQVHLDKGGKTREKFQTETDNSKNPSPAFNKTFRFSLRETEIRDSSLVIQVRVGVKNIERAWYRTILVV